MSTIPFLRRIVFFTENTEVIIWNVDLKCVEMKKKINISVLDIETVYQLDQKLILYCGFYHENNLQPIYRIVVIDCDNLFDYPTNMSTIDLSHLDCVKQFHIRNPEKVPKFLKSSRKNESHLLLLEYGLVSSVVVDLYSKKSMIIDNLSMSNFNISISHFYDDNENNLVCHFPLSSDEVRRSIFKPLTKNEETKLFFLFRTYNDLEGEYTLFDLVSIKEEKIVSTTRVDIYPFQKTNLDSFRFRNPLQISRDQFLIFIEGSICASILLLTIDDERNATVTTNVERLDTSYLRGAEEKESTFIKNNLAFYFLPARKKDYQDSERVIFESTNLPHDLVKIVVDFITF
jgi:hypothetical protein